MQTSYNFDMEIAQAGLKADNGFHNVLTYRATEAIPFGSGLVQGDIDKDARLPLSNVAVITFDADFVTSNSITLEVNGEEVGPVVFDTDQETTIEALAAAIDALDDIDAEVTDAREITVKGGDMAIEIDDIEITGGVSQADSEIEYKSGDFFVGVALFDQGFMQDLDGKVLYEKKDPVSVLTRGRVYVLAEQDIKAGDPVFVRFMVDGDKVRGGFRKDDDDGKAMLVDRARYLKDVDEGGFAVVEINLP